MESESKLRITVRVVVSDGRGGPPQTLNREGILDLAELPSSIEEMPQRVTGRILFQDGDIYSLDLNPVKRVIFNQTQVQYDLELTDQMGRFTATRTTAASRSL